MLTSTSHDIAGGYQMVEDREDRQPDQNLEDGAIDRIDEDIEHSEEGESDDRDESREPHADRD
ncbi:MAG TPA: hypothetical protein VH583_25865 [Vicinamibacterales bacterium]